jgi:long-chain fatty acid transport protein
MRFPSFRRTAPWVLVLLMAAPARPVAAAGFAIFEEGARGMGFAGAFTAQASDPSAIFHNAAGIAFLRGKQIYFGGTLIRPSSEFEGTDPFPGAGVTEKQDIGLLKVPSVYYSQALGSGAAIGIGLHVPFGLKTQWENPDSFTGRYISTRAELKGFALNPTLAVKLADRLAIGAGVDVRLSSVQLEQRIPSVNPFTQKVVDVAAVDLTTSTKTGVGFNVGILGKPTEQWAIGLAYRHKVKIDYAGTAAFDLLGTGSSELDTLVARTLPAAPVPVTTTIEFPAFLSAGVAFSPEDWVVEADVNWYQWSTFATLPIQLEGREDLSRVVQERYENTLQFRVGLERRITDDVFVRAGYFFDQTPAPPESISPLLPDSDRHGFALGASFISGRFRLDAAAWYVRSPDRSTDGINRDHYDGTYKSKAATLGISMGYSF